MTVSGRISFSVDEDRRIVIVGLHGVIEGQAFIDQLTAGLKALSRPWAYDYIDDMRQYEGVTLFKDLETFASVWADLVKGHDKGHLVALISTNPVIRFRLSATRALFPMNRIENFDTLDEGLEWILASRGVKPLTPPRQTP